MKQNVDPTPYLTSESPITVKGHYVTVRKQHSNVTRVIFKHVPFNIPDEEILHLCIHYGKPVIDLQYEKMAIKAIRVVLGPQGLSTLSLSQGSNYIIGWRGL